MKVQFITKRSNTARGFFKTWKFDSVEQGWDFLAKYGLDHLVVDVLR